MTYQVIENFISGQDTRKSPLTSAAGTLTRLINAMVTPGGEIAKRRAFVNVANVSGTFGLAATETALYVFGRNADPTLPAWSVPGVTLKGANIPNTDATLQVTDYDVFDGQIYIACRTGTGPLQEDPAPTAAQNPHYYLGPRVPLTVIYDGNLTEGAGKGYYVRTFQSKMYAVLGKLLWYSAIGNPVIWNEESLIDTVVVTKVDNLNPIMLTVSTSEINQFVVNNYVYVSGVTVAGLTGANGFRKIAAVSTVNGTFTLVGVNGLSATADQTDSKVRATPAILVTQISNTNPAKATVAAADITKFTNGQKVRINGVSGGIVPVPPPSTPNANLFVIDDVGNPANTFTLVGLNASAAAAPQTADTWATLTTDAVRTGRGWNNVSLVDADSERLKSLEVYYDKLAIFSTQATQIWAVDPDPLQNAFEQLLRGSGTTAPRSPLQYGSGDVLFLDPSGVRSLKAKDSSNSAAVSDIGSPVDPAVRAIRIDPLKGDVNYADKAISLLEPSVGRFWMIFPKEILVLSYFPGPKITAWSTLTLPELGSATVEYAVSCGGKIFLRDSADNIWVYGGLDGLQYNNPVVEIRFPYLDAKKPGHKKTFQAFDATVNSTDEGASSAWGSWRVAVSYDFNNPNSEETLATISSPTWNMGASEMQGYDSHYSLRFYNNDSLPATISNCAAHYNMADEET